MTGPLLRRVGRTNIYYGPPEGIYALERFEEFVKKDVSARLDEIGSPSICNTEEHGSANTTYHFPDAGIGVEYQLPSQKRCIVNLVGTRPGELRDIAEFIISKQ